MLIMNMCLLEICRLHPRRPKRNVSVQMMVLSFTLMVTDMAFSIMQFVHMLVKTVLTIKNVLLHKHMVGR